MLPNVAHNYLINALEGTPAVLNQLLGGLAPDDTRWDARPDPERFSLREIVAHLTSAEPNWLARASRMRDEDEPFFPRLPIQDAEIESRSVSDNLAALAEGRRQFVEFLKGLDEAHWARVGRSEFLGPVTIEQQAVFVLVHDGYHARQIAEWLATV